jgi:hypothetical protein
MTMTTIAHRSTAKATLRSLLSTYGSSGTIALLGEVVLESVPRRRGRPTRDEKVARLIAKTLDGLLPELSEAEHAAAEAAEARSEEKDGEVAVQKRPRKAKVVEATPPVEPVVPADAPAPEAAQQ